MTRTVSTLLLALSLSSLALAQDSSNIRNPTINTESDEGKPLVAAGLAESAAERIPILEGYLQQFPQGEYRGYALFQAQKAYMEAGQDDKVVEVGKELMKLVPNDLEVRHNVNQALVKLQRWDELAPLLDQTRPIAEKQVAEPQPSGADEEAAAHWKSQKEYAEGVVQWLEWATNTAALQQTDPKAKVAWMDRLTTTYPDGQFSKGLETQYVVAYQQMGDQDNMVAWMKKAVDAGSQDETYYYTLAEDALNKQDEAAAKTYADKTLELLESKPVPEGMSEAQWTEHKNKIGAYTEFLYGRIYMPKNTKDAYRAARSHMLKSVDVLKAEGGPRYHVLAYYLGVCYVQLDIQGDNIKQAAYWMGQAASTDGQFKGQAAEALKKINAAR
ncbi:MAG: hypothetical protein R2748_01325 [Bryobacterales bacterium]